jgi:hypothetical protein
MDLESVRIPSTIWSDRNLLSGLDVSPIIGNDAAPIPTAP